MCDLDLYRARIGLFSGVLSVRTVLTRESSKVRKLTTNDTGVSSLDILSTYVFCWLLALLCASVFTNVRNFSLQNVSMLNEQSERSGTVVCCDSVCTRGDNISLSFTLVLAMHVPAIVFSLSAINPTFSAWRLRLSGDVEENPGPDPAASQADSNGGTKENDDHTCMPAAMDELVSKITLIVQQQIQDHTHLIRTDLSAIREEVGDIKLQCQQINDRCNRLEKEQQDLSHNVAILSADINSVFEEVTAGKEETNKVKTSVQELKEEVTNLTSEVDRLESFSRRDNLRFFGITPNSEVETGDSCVTTLVDTLNSVDDSRRWREEDIVRAHRVGQARNGQPRPLIARFTRWKDKMSVITNRDLKDRLKKNGINVANDLTRRQANTVAQARREGRRAFFRNGVMVMGPPLPDPRTYAQVTATRGDNTVGVAASERGNTGGVSPTHHTSGQGRVVRRQDTPCDITQTQSAWQPRGAVNRDVGGSASPCDARAEGRQSLDSSAAGSQPGDSLIGQSSRGTRWGDTASPSPDVTNQASGSRIGQPLQGGGGGAGVPPRDDVVRRDVADCTTGTRGARRASATRQTGLRGYLGNRAGAGSDRSLRNKKSK